MTIVFHYATYILCTLHYPSLITNIVNLFLVMLLKPLKVKNLCVPVILHLIILLSLFECSFPSSSYFQSVSQYAHYPSTLVSSSPSSSPHLSSEISLLPQEFSSISQHLDVIIRDYARNVHTQAFHGQLLIQICDSIHSIKHQLSSHGSRRSIGSCHYI